MKTQTKIKIEEFILETILKGPLNIEQNLKETTANRANIHAIGYTTESQPQHHRNHRNWANQAQIYCLK